MKHPAPSEVCRTASGDVIRSCASDGRARERKDSRAAGWTGLIGGEEACGIPSQLGRARVNRLSRTRPVWYLRGWGSGRRGAAMALTPAGCAEEIMYSATAKSP